MRIEGEYITVSSNVNNALLLKQAHLTPMTPDEAALLLINMMKFHNFYLKKLRFAERCNGVYFYKEKYMRLPRIPLPPGENRPYYYLTLGCVLHEFAHALANESGAKGHDWSYIRVIEKLVTRYYNGDYK